MTYLHFKWWENTSTTYQGSLTLNWLDQTTVKSKVKVHEVQKSKINIRSLPKSTALNKPENNLSDMWELFDNSLFACAMKGCGADVTADIPRQEREGRIEAMN